MYKLCFTVGSGHTSLVLCIFDQLLIKVKVTLFCGYKVGYGISNISFKRYSNKTPNGCSTSVFLMCILLVYSIYTYIHAHTHSASTCSDWLNLNWDLNYLSLKRFMLNTNGLNKLLTASGLEFMNTNFCDFI